MAHTPVFEFLKRRYASAIERADDRTATRLRAAIGHLLDDPPAPGALAGPIVDLGSRWPSRPPQAQPAPDQGDILSAHDDIPGPHL